MPACLHRKQRSAGPERRQLHCPPQQDRAVCRYNPRQRGTNERQAHTHRHTHTGRQIGNRQKQRQSQSTKGHEIKWRYRRHRQTHTTCTMSAQGRHDNALSLKRRGGFDGIIPVNFKIQTRRAADSLVNVLVPLLHVAQHLGGSTNLAVQTWRRTWAPRQKKRGVTVLCACNSSPPPPPFQLEGGGGLHANKKKKKKKKKKGQEEEGDTHCQGSLGAGAGQL